MVTLIKRCKRHGIVLGEAADTLETPFIDEFPNAQYDAEAGEWVIPWETGFYTKSNARLEAFFTARNQKIRHINRC